MSIHQNKELVRRWYEDVLSGGTVSRQYLSPASPDVTDTDLGRMFAADYVNHVSPAPPEGWKRGVEAARQIIRIYRFSSPDLAVTILNQVEEGDMVATYYTISATHTAKSFFGIPATGKKYTMTGFGLERIENGRIAESWGMWDTYALMEQMGILPQTTHLG